MESMKSETSSKLLVTSEVGRILGISSEMVRYLERVGKIRAHKTPGGMRIFEREEVDRVASERAALKVGLESRPPETCMAT